MISLFGTFRFVVNVIYDFFNHHDVALLTSIPFAIKQKSDFIAGK